MALSNTVRENLAQAFRNARFQYKNQPDHEKLKSNNKLYLNMTPDKNWNRNHSAIFDWDNWTLSEDYIVSLSTDTTRRARGQVRVEQGSTHGNCGDMAEAVVHHCELSGIDLQIVCFASAYDKNANRRADHGFVVAHDGKEHLATATSIYNMRSLPEHTMYVLDTWTGIFCDAKQYARELHSKLLTWRSQGKIVLFDPEDVREEYVEQLKKIGRSKSADARREALEKAIRALGLDKFDHELYAENLARATLSYSSVDTLASNF